PEALPVSPGSAAAVRGDAEDLGRGGESLLGAPDGAEPRRRVAEPRVLGALRLVEEEPRLRDARLQVVGLGRARDPRAGPPLLGERAADPPPVARVLVEERVERVDVGVVRRLSEEGEELGAEAVARVALDEHPEHGRRIGAALAERLERAPADLAEARDGERRQGAGARLLVLELRGGGELVGDRAHVGDPRAELALREAEE